MKKIALLFAGISLLSFCSCKKERTCTCTTIENNGSATVSTVKFTKINKRQAKDACANSSRTTTFGTTTSTSKSDCKLS